MPPNLLTALQSCISDWGDDLAGMEGYLSSLTHLLPDLAFDPERNRHEAWIIAVADAPEDVPLPRPPENTAQFLFDRAAEWESVFQGYAGQPEVQKIALWQQGYFHYFACLAQTVSAQFPAALERPAP